MRKKKKKTSRKKKKIRDDSDVAFLRQLTIIAGLVLLAVITGIVIFVTSYQDTGGEIDFSIEIPEEKVVRSIPFEISIDIENGTESVLSDVQVTLAFSEGLVSLGYGDEGTTITDSVGEVEKNSVSKRTYRILPVLPPGASPEITGTLLYKIGETEFEKEISKGLEIEEQALSVDIEKPEQILAGSVFDITVNYRNSSEFDFSDFRLEMSYPDNFTFVSAELEPDSFNNYWRLGTLKGNSKGKLTIRGKFGSGGEEPNFGAELFAVFNEKSYAAAETENELRISKPPIYLKTRVKGSRDYIAQIGDSLQYTIDYKNESGVALNNAAITAELTGELFDYSTLVSDAKFNSLTKTLTWDDTTNSELNVLEPGESGTVRINVGLNNSFLIKRLNDKNFVLKVNAEIESPTVPYYLSADKTTAGDSLETKVRGLTTIDAQAYYRDPDSGIANDGLIPPEVGEATEYTIHWVIRNYGTDVKNVKVSAELPEGVEWTGVMKSNLSSVPLYDEETKVMSWEIDEIAATKGVLSSPIETVFQVKATPSEDKVGQFQPLLSQTTLQAKDQFTGLTLNSSDVFLNTSLNDDSTVVISEGLVVE